MESTLDLLLKRKPSKKIAEYIKEDDDNDEEELNKEDVGEDGEELQAEEYDDEYDQEDTGDEVEAGDDSVTDDDSSTEDDSGDEEDIRSESDDFDAETKDTPDEEIDSDEKDDKPILPKPDEKDDLGKNPLDNVYAVNYTIGDPVVLVYTDNRKSKLTAVIDGYDKQGFYILKWGNNKRTPGVTDTMISSIVQNQESTMECICGSKNIIKENNNLVCDDCGRLIDDKRKSPMKSVLGPVNTGNKPNIPLSEETEDSSKTIVVKLHTGVWGSHTGEHTEYYVRKAIKTVKNTAKTLEANITSVENNKITILVTKCTSNQLDKLMKAIRNSVITISDVELVR